MAFIRERVFIELILPLMMQETTSIIGLTTPKGEKKQFFLRLMRAKDTDGNPIFLEIRSKEFCEECANLGKADSCPHEIYGRSTNKNAKSMQKARMVYGEEYAVEAEQELLGMDSTISGSIIPKEHITKFFESTVPLNGTYRCAYLSMDPGGGGQTSQMGIVIAVETLDTAGVRITLVNVTGYPVRLQNGASSERAACLNAIQWIKNQPYLNGLYIIVMVEAAPAIQSSYIFDHLTEAGNKYGVHLIYMREATNEKKQRIPGIFKNAHLQIAYRMNFQTVLEKGYLTWTPEIATLRSDSNGHAELSRLVEMMSYYHIDEKKNIITSKGSGVDDILSALVQMLYFGQVFWSDSFYQKQRELIIKQTGYVYAFPGSGINILAVLPTGQKRKTRN